MQSVIRLFPAKRLFRFESQIIAATAAPIRVGAAAFSGFGMAGLGFAGVGHAPLATVFLGIASLGLLAFLACVLMRNEAQARIDSETLRAISASLAEGRDTPAIGEAA